MSAPSSSPSRRLDVVEPGMSRATVVLPEPVAPTSATDFARRHPQVEAVEHRLGPAVAEAHASEAHLAAPGGQGGGPGGSSTSGSVDSTSSTRSADTAARWDWATIMPSIRSGQISMAM